MNKLDSKLFSEDERWLSGTYKTTEVAFVVSEYFARYVRKRWPVNADDTPDGRGHLYLEFVDVDFKPLTECPRKRVRVGYASNVLQILLPDRGYSEEEKETLRDFYQLKYAPILKESHLRTNALLWLTFSDDEKNEILGLFKTSTAIDANIKKAILEELETEKSSAETDVMKMQTTANPRGNDEE